MGKNNGNEFGRIWKIDRSIAKTVCTSCAKWVNLEKSESLISLSSALYAKTRPIDDEVVNFINYCYKYFFISYFSAKYSQNSWKTKSYFDEIDIFEDT